MAYLKHRTIVELFSHTILKCYKARELDGLNIVLTQQQKLEEIERKCLFDIINSGERFNSFEIVMKCNMNNLNAEDK